MSEDPDLRIAEGSSCPGKRSEEQEFFQRNYSRKYSAILPAVEAVRVCSIFHLYWLLKDDLRLEWGSIHGTPPVAPGPEPQRPGSAILPLTYLLTRGLPVSGNPELNARLKGKRVWRRNYAPTHCLRTQLHVERGSSDPGINLWFWRPFSSICARLRTIWTKPPELEDYSGRMRRLIARRFRTVEFGRVSVRNSSFDIFPRNLCSVSRNSHGWILRALWFTF